MSIFAVQPFMEGASHDCELDVKMDENHQGAIVARGPCPLYVSVPSKTATTVIRWSILATPLRRRGFLAPGWLCRTA